MKKDLSELPAHYKWYGITNRETNGPNKHYFWAESLALEVQEIASILQEVWRKVIKEHDFYTGTSFIDDMRFYRAIADQPDTLLFAEPRKRFNQKLWYIPSETFIHKIVLNAFDDPFTAENPMPELMADAIRNVRDANKTRFAEKRIEINLNPLFTQSYPLNTSVWYYPYAVKPSLKVWNDDVEVSTEMILTIANELKKILEQGSELKAKQLMRDVFRSVK